MRKVAITGANGFVGTHLIERLTGSAWQAIPLVRSARGLSDEIVTGPLEAAAATDLPPIETFVHLAARTHVTHEHAADPMTAYRQVNVQGTQAALEMAKRAGAKHFVFLSSVKAMGEQTAHGAPFTEESAPAPEDEYGITKLEAEDLVRHTCTREGMSWTIVRPPLVYGPGVRANFLALAKLVRQGIPLPFGAVHNRRSLVYVKNLADFLAFCLDQDAARDRVFVIADETPLSTAGLVRALAKAEGRSARLISIAPFVFRVGLRIVGKGGVYRRLFTSLELDPSAAHETGWTQPFPQEEGFAATISAL